MAGQRSVICALGDRKVSLDDVTFMHIGLSVSQCLGSAGQAAQGRCEHLAGTETALTCPVHVWTPVATLTILLSRKALEAFG